MKKRLWVFIAMLCLTQALQAGGPVVQIEKLESILNRVDIQRWMEFRDRLSEDAREILIPKSIARLIEIREEAGQTRFKHPGREKKPSIRILETGIWTDKVEIIFQEWDGSAWANLLRNTLAFAGNNQIE
ncbi:MAG TPA: hypothetical protein ENN03_10290 [bacterium]|nr:hypothetical protein [bacterium]